MNGREFAESHASDLARLRGSVPTLRCHGGAGMLLAICSDHIDDETCRASFRLLHLGKGKALVVDETVRDWQTRIVKTPLHKMSNDKKLK